MRRTPEQQNALFRRYVPELVEQPMMQFFERTFGLWLIGMGIVLFAVGGLPLLLWGLCVRMVVAYHSTWFVNSATHLWGYRNYETRDESRNLWWVALLSYGEGWHNNHHAHPHTARAGHKWWEIDMTFWAIRALQWCGLATDVDDRIPSQAA
jgi:stearoyl-CoA desaturase (delta-9 desaturase)